jgi:2-oxo-4-hydroxy-4-carboxy-5-ureidoimidazoline decarboxylase
LTIAELNAADRAGFVDAVGWVFEHSPWVANRAWERRPFDTVDALHDAMTRVVSDAPRDEQLALLRAHPDLGARAKLSGASAGEQTGAGLDRLTPEEFTRLQELNDTYRQRFSFPFLFAVKSSTTQQIFAQQIFEALETRLLRTFEEEFDEALRQVSRIARFRLDDCLCISRPA